MKLEKNEHASPAIEELAELRNIIQHAGDLMESGMYNSAADALNEGVVPLLFLIGHLRDKDSIKDMNRLKITEHLRLCR